MTFDPFEAHVAAVLCPHCYAASLYVHLKIKKMSSSESGSDWESEVEDSQTSCMCLFCTRDFDGGVKVVLAHCTDEHDFKLMNFIEKLGLDFYSCIKLVNYIRKERPDQSSVLNVHPPFPWEHNSYLTPVITDDPLLQLDFDPTAGDSPLEMSSEVVCVSKDNGDLAVRLSEMERQVEHYKEALSRAHLDLESMRLAVQAIVDDNALPSLPSSPDDATSIDSDSYFQSYSHHSIHEEMLKDQLRTDAYKVFIEKNLVIFKDKVVLDVGCGTGVLSMFAARAGAQKVIGVDQSSIIYKAMDIVRENNLEDRVTLIKGKVEEIDLPVDKVDVIISEWMGYFLLFESMLDTVLYARDKWLNDPTKLFPSNCSISLVALGNKFEWNSKIQFWDNVYGFKMSCMKEEVLKEASVCVIDPYSTISSSDTVKKFDLSETDPSDLEFEAPFEMTLQSDTVCHAIGGYFDVGFEKVPFLMHLSTSPSEDPTHWKQTVFYLAKPFQVHTGDLLKGSIQCSKVKCEPRSLEITISYELLSFIPDSEPIKCKQKYFLR